MSRQSLLTSRGFLAALVLVSALAAFATLVYVGRDGGISEENTRAGMNYMLEYYLPVLGTIGGFYFAGRTRAAAAGTATGIRTAFAFAFALVAIWSLLPILCFGMAPTYESAIRYLDTLKPVRAIVATGAIAFLFAKPTTSPL